MSGPFFKTTDKVPVTLEVIQAIGVILNALFDEPLIVRKEDPPKEKAFRYPDKTRCRAKSWFGERCTKILGHEDGVHRNRHLFWGAGKSAKKKGVAKKARPAKRRTKGRRCRSENYRTGLRCALHGSHSGNHRSSDRREWLPSPRVTKKRKAKRMMYPEHPQCQARHPNDHSVRCYRSVGHRGRHKDGTFSWERRK